MKFFKEHLSKLGLLIAVIGSSFFLFGTHATFAATKTWTGSGGNSNLATAGNWSPSGAPASGDSLVFPIETVFGACSADVTLNNDIDSSSVTLGGISFTGSRPSGCNKALSVTGNGIKTSGNISSNNSFTFQVPITATADIEITSLGSESVLNVGSNNVTLTYLTHFATITGTGTLTLGSAFQGGAGGGCGDGSAYSDPITGDGSGFSGAIVSNEIALTVSPRSNDIARHASSITVNPGGSIGFTMNYHEDTTFAKNITFNGGRLFASQVSKEIGGDCASPSAMKSLNLTGTLQFNQDVEFIPLLVNIKLVGQVNGLEHVLVGSGYTGQVTLPDQSVLSSDIAVETISDTANCNSIYVYEAHKSIVNADCSGTTVSIYGGILAGSGSVGNVTVKPGGKIAPGNSPGTLSTGDLTFEEGGIYDFEIAGDEAGQYDQINVTGTVNLGNGTLSISQLDGFKPSAGKSFVIIANDGDDVVEGTFKDLPQGATITVDGAAYTISYTGGDGNDVELTAIPSGSNTGNPKNSTPVAYIVGAGLISAAIVVKKLKKLQRRR